MKFKFSSFYQSFFKKGQAQTAEQNTDQAADQSNTEEYADEVSSGTKLKVIMALLVVGFAGYVAYWVQEPSDLKTDILQVPTQSESIAQMDEMNASSLSTTQEVAIANFQFDPSVLTIEKGTTIIWTNKDATPHTVTSDGFSSNSIAPGQSFTYSFNNDGTYDYYCAFHPQMKAKIIVGTGINIAVPLNNTQQISNSDDQSQSQVAVSQDDQTADQLIDNDLNIAAESLSDTFLQDLPLTNTSNHAAAPESLSTSVSKVIGGGDSNGTGTSNATISNSGPEDYIYALMLCGILYFNRRKLLGYSK